MIDGEKQWFHEFEHFIIHELGVAENTAKNIVIQVATSLTINEIKTLLVENKGVLFAILKTIVKEGFGVKLDSANREESKIVEEAEDKKFEFKIRNLLIELGISAQLKGFKLIIDAIKEIYDVDYFKLTAVYNSLGKKSGDTIQRIERAIRHAIETGWSRNPEEFSAILGKKIKEKPINSEFLALAVNYLKFHS